MGFYPHLNTVFLLLVSDKTSIGVRSKERHHLTFCQFRNVYSLVRNE